MKPRTVLVACFVATLASIALQNLYYAHHAARVEPIDPYHHLALLASLVACWCVVAAAVAARRHRSAASLAAFAACTGLALVSCATSGVVT